MTPGFANALSGLADAVIARVRSDGATARDGELLIAVLKFTSSVRSDTDRLHKVCSISTDEAAHLTKALDGLADLEKRLQDVAAEPAPRPGEPYRGVSLHLIGRALRFDTPTWGNA